MRHHSIVLTLALLAGGAAALPAQTVLRPLPSSRATSEVTLAPPDSLAASVQPATIRLDYGQPHLRGRTLHTDSLVPYDQVWRTGANAATSLTTGVDLVLGGTALPAGRYTLTTLPSRAGWKLIVQRDSAHEVARIDLRAQTTSAPLESLTMWLIPTPDLAAARGELRLAWGTTMLATDWVVK